MILSQLPPHHPSRNLQQFPAPKPGPKLDLSLVGTIIESNKSLAIIADPNGGFDVKGVGEMLEIAPDGIVITSIQSGQVTLEHQGKNDDVKSRTQAENEQGSERKSQ